MEGGRVQTFCTLCTYKKNSYIIFSRYFFFQTSSFKSEHDVKKENLRRALQPTFTYSKSTTETTEQYVKIVRSFR